MEQEEDENSKDYRKLLDCIAISDDSNDGSSSDDASGNEGANIPAGSKSRQNPNPKSVLQSKDSKTTQLIQPQPGTSTVQPNVLPKTRDPVQKSQTKMENYVDYADPSKRVRGEKLPMYPPVSLTKDKIREVINNVAKNNERQNQSVQLPEKPSQKQQTPVQQPQKPAQHSPKQPWNLTAKTTPQSLPTPVNQKRPAEQTQSSLPNAVVIENDKSDHDSTGSPRAAKRSAMELGACIEHSAPTKKEIGLQTDSVGEESNMSADEDLDDEGKRIFEGGGKLIRDRKVCNDIHAVVNLEARGRYVVTPSHHCVLTDKHYKFEVVGGCLDSSAFLNLSLNLTGSAPCSVAVDQLPAFK